MREKHYVVTKRIAVYARNPKKAEELVDLQLGRTESCCCNDMAYSLVEEFSPFNKTVSVKETSKATLIRARKAREKKEREYFEHRRKNEHKKRK